MCRDIVIANVLGAGMLTDAFFVAFKISNFLRRLFAEGAFNAAFLPIFAGMLKVDGRKRALHFASSIMTILLAILLLIILLAVIFMPSLLAIIAPGFQEHTELHELTVTLTRITFPYLLFISLVSLFGGILNSLNRFAAVAFTPVLLNISLIGFLLLIPDMFASHAHALSAGVLCAGLLQCVWLIYVACRYDMLPRLVRPKWNEDIRRMLLAFGPVALGAGVAQINQLVDVVLATYLDTAVSYLYYAERLYELPVGVIGIAVATALLPMLSGHIRASEQEEAARAMDQALRFVSLIGWPAAAALIVLADPIIATIYQHGEFAANDSAAVAPALIAYSCGVPAFLMSKIFSNCFFAAEDTKTPVKIAVITMITNVALNLLLIGPYGHVGLAVATTVAGWFNAVLLAYFLHNRAIFALTWDLLKYMAKLMLAITAMVIVLHLCLDALHHWFDRHLQWRIAGMLTLIIAGAGSYFAVAFISGALSRNEIRAWLKKAH